MTDYKLSESESYSSSNVSYLHPQVDASAIPNMDTQEIVPFSFDALPETPDQLDQSVPSDLSDQVIQDAAPEFTYYDAAQMLERFGRSVSETRDTVKGSSERAIDTITADQASEEKLKVMGKERMAATLEQLFSDAVDHDERVRDEVIAKNNRIIGLVSRFERHNNGALSRIGALLGQYVDEQDEHKLLRAEVDDSIAKWTALFDQRKGELADLESELAILESESITLQQGLDKNILEKTRLEDIENAERRKLISNETIQAMVTKHTDPIAFAREMQAALAAVSSLSIAAIQQQVSDAGTAISSLSRMLNEIEGPDGVIEKAVLQIEATKDDLEKLPGIIAESRAALAYQDDVIAPRVLLNIERAKRVLSEYDAILQGDLRPSTYTTPGQILSEVYKAAVDLHNELTSGPLIPHAIEWSSPIFDIEIPLSLRENPDDKSTTFDVQTRNLGKRFTEMLDKSSVLRPWEAFSIEGLSIESIKRRVARAGKTIRITNKVDNTKQEA
jgi:hypothetical protein